MGFICPNCDQAEVEYMNANMSQCKNCNTTVPNAHLHFLEKNNQTTLTDVL